MRAQPEAGIGNRLLGIVAALILAMLTQRVLLVGFPDVQLEMLLQEPFEGTSWLIPPETMERLSKFDSGLPRGNQPKRLVKLNLFADSPESHLRTILCGHDEQLSAVQVLMPQSYQYFVPLLFYNPQYRNRLLQWFPDRNIFHRVANLVLKPTLPILEQVSANVAAFKGKTIGLQIRNFDNLYSEAVSKQVLICLANREVDSIYVAALLPDYSRFLRLNSNYTILQPYAAGRQGHSTEHLMDAMIDIWTLAQTDHRLVTGVSTFGYIATGLAGKPSDFISTEHCWPQETPEPCQHFRQPQLNPQLCGTHSRRINFLSEHMTICEDGKLGFLLRT